MMISKALYDIIPQGRGRINEDHAEGQSWPYGLNEKSYNLQSVTKYLRLTLVFMWNGAPRKKFNGYFSGRFC